MSSLAEAFAYLESKAGRDDSGKHYSTIMQGELNSKSRFHLVGSYMDGKPLPNCQSHNLDKPNFLDSATRISSDRFSTELFAELEWNLCRKCFKGIISL